MRDLNQNELQYVGGGCSPCPPSEHVKPKKDKCRDKSKGNNGFGNGGNDGSNAGKQDETR